MERDTHGLRIGDRVVEEDAQVVVEGEITDIDAEAGTCSVRWDNAHESRCTPIDSLIPVGGW
jgi:hypothetical protein